MASKIAAFPQIAAFSVRFGLYQTMRTQRPTLVRLPRLVIVAWVAVVLWGLGIVVLAGTPAAQHLSNVGLATAAFAAGCAACCRARRRQDATMRFWWLLGGAALSWSVGQMVWTYYESVQGDEVPFPSLADVGYLGLPPLAAAALLSLPLAAPSLAGRVRTLLDGLMVATSLLLCSWIIVLGPVFRADADSFPVQLISFAYPIGDVIVITLVLYTWSRARHLHRRLSVPLPLVGSGLLAFAVADSGFTYLTTVGAYSSGSLIDLGWFVGFVLVLVAALQPEQEAAEATDPGPAARPLGNLLPYGAVSVALLTSLVEMVRTGQTDAVIWWIRTIIMVLLVVRQILTMLENQALTEHLEHRVEQRTAELRESRNLLVAGLQKEADAVRRLEQLDRAKDEFVATVSHELRTPLTSIKGYVELLLDAHADDADPTLTQMLLTVQRNGDRLATLTENLLAVARLESGEIDLDLKPVDLGDVVGRIEAALRPVISERDLEVHYAVPPDPVLTNGDVGYLERVLFNLMSNALKFTEDGGSVCCSLRREGDRAVLEVADTGIGIPLAEQDHLFTRFFRSSTAQRQAIQGTGLGLAIASSIVRRHGGEIEVRSEQGRGTTVRVVLPSITADATRSQRHEVVRTS